MNIVGVGKIFDLFLDNPILEYLLFVFILFLCLLSYKRYKDKKKNKLEFCDSMKRYEKSISPKRRKIKKLLSLD